MNLMGWEEKRERERERERTTLQFGHSLRLRFYSADVYISKIVLLIALSYFIVSAQITVHVLVLC